MKEALKLAQRALSNKKASNEVIYKALHAIKEALAQPEQEPVAWATRMGEYAHIHWGAKRPEYPMVYEAPLYTTPPQEQQSCDRRTWGKPWVSLTDEEKELIVGMFCKKDSSHDDAERVAKAIEAKLKEKNT